MAKSYQNPSSKTIFFDVVASIALDGRSLNSPQAGHCLVEVEKTFVSAGGFTSNVRFSKLSFTWLTRFGPGEV